VLAAWQRSPVALALSNADVFWVEQGSAEAADGAVKRVPLGGGTPELLARGQAAPRSIVLDSGNPLWTVRGDGPEAGALMRLELDSGSPSALVAGRSRPEGVARNEKKVFWTEWNTGVHLAELTGSGETSIPSSDDRRFPYAIAAARDAVCWTEYGMSQDSGRVMCSDIDTRTGAVAPGRVVGGAERTPHAIALETDAAGNAVAVVWANYGSGEIVQGRPREVDSRQVLARDQDGPSGVALDADAVYWTSRGKAAVVRLSRRDDGATPEVVASGRYNPGAIAVNRDAVFWVDEGSPGRANGAVVRLARR
jgi:hypothetical protein